jgi:cardiolipin synthase
MLIPVLGVIPFLASGRTRRERQRFEQPAEVNAILAERTAIVPTPGSDHPLPAYVRSVATLNQNLGAQPAMPGNRVDLIRECRGSVAAMTAEVDRASAWVHVEFYITAWTI